MVTIEQIRVGFDNFSYIVFCPIIKKASIVDPGYDVSKTLRFISSKNLELEYIIITHHHIDHSSETKKVKNLYPLAKIVASNRYKTKQGMKVEINVSDGEQLKLGKVSLNFILTPGHTPDGICIIVDNEALITGDTLFIGDCGRTDLSGGDLVQMYKTLNEKIMTLPDHLIVYPGHDYGDKPFDNLGNQKRTNKTLLAKNFTDFSKIY